MARGAFVLLLMWVGILILLSGYGEAEDPSVARRTLFERRCAGCHAIDENKEGPRLRGVYGRKSGSVPSFLYSDALKKAGVTWNAASLDKWLTDPENLIPNTDMDFRVSKPEERGEIIAYLKQISGK